MKERLATLISGGGTTMNEIIKACQSGEIPMDFGCVVSSTASALGLGKARKLGIPEEDLLVIDPNDYRNKEGKIDQEDFSWEILRRLRMRAITVVTQNGWMPLTPQAVIDEYPQTMFNQHPGPVPEFGGKGMYGKRVHAARLNFVRATGRDFWTEAIAQRVHSSFDQGRIVCFERVEIREDDTVDSLQQRVLPIEHRIQIELLKQVAAGTVRELPVREPLVRPGEEVILFEAKKAARSAYPHG